MLHIFRHALRLQARGLFSRQLKSKIGGEPIPAALDLLVQALDLDPVDSGQVGYS